MSSNFARITILNHDPNANEPELDSRAEAAELWAVNDTATLAVDENDNAQYRRTMAINLTESVQQSEVNTLKREYDRYQKLLDELHKPNGELKRGAPHHLVGAYKAKLRQLEEEIALVLEVGHAMGATRMSQTPPHLVGGAGFETPKITSGIGKGIGLTLEEIADDPDQDEFVRQKARAELKRRRGY